VRTVGWRVLSHHWRSLRSATRAHRRYGQPPDAPPPSEDAVALVAALRRLPAAQRQAIVLHHILDIPVGEIAAETGTAEGTIKARLSRGRAALAEILTVRTREEEHA
jgi:RNA polymerase sigma factor (sigma-70 family)